MLQIIDDNVERLDRMVQDVLQLSQRDRLRQERLELNDFLRKFHAQYCEIEKIRPQGIQLDITEKNMQVLFDPQHLQQVLWNLCRNGWRHSRKQDASLRVSLRSGIRQHGIEIVVSDDGAGVAADARPHLFEPFFTTEASGTGLGLFVARELCEANGAGLDYVESANGANFKIYLKEAA